MKISLLTFLVISVFVSTSFSQKKLQLHDKKFSHEIERELAEKQLRQSAAAYYYTYIGNYRKAIESYSIQLNWGLDSLSHSDSLSFLKYKPVNAIPYLKEKTKDEQVVIISEAHQMPQHRIFTTTLLKDLYENGFRHLGLETITPSYADSTKFLLDTILNERGYPLNSPLTGYYTREPQMGNLVREAIRLGFDIFGYERTHKKTERDLQQATKIKKYMDAHPNEKVVIHCGWHHAIESNYPKRKSDNYMAYHLKNLTGIDPLTIYQDALSERVINEESPYFKMINARKVSVLIDDDGNIFNGIGENRHFDILIYHPRTQYIKNRPDWLLRSPENQFVPVEKNRIQKEDYPVIVEAFLPDEVNSVPIDVIELQSKDDLSELILKKGEYLIRITNRDRVEKEYETRVE